MRKLKITFLVFISVFASLTYGQDAEPEIDASKPTNFYSMLDNTLEFSSRPNENVMGYRGKIIYAPSAAHLVLAEVPLLYNSRTKKFGVGDLRARYFWLPYKNYDKLLGAFGPSIDVFAPSGSFENGLGSDRWLVSPGLTVGLMVADWIQLFPIVSYQYASAPLSEAAENAGIKETHGITFQVLAPIVFSEKFFMQITPIYQMNNLKDERQDRYIQELFASYSITKTMQITGYYNGNFKDEIHTLSLGLTVFLVN